MFGTDTTFFDSDETMVFRLEAPISTLKKQQVEGSVFAGLDRIKVVAHCPTRNKAFERYVLPSRYDPLDLCRAELFQYLVGTTDFGFFDSEDECCHNGKAFSFPDDSHSGFPVPYDFDISGLVNVSYAVVNPNFPILSVRDRLYRGLETSNDTLKAVFNLFLKEEDEIRALWNGADFLPEATRKDAVRFIEDFYKDVRSSTTRKRKIIGKMRHFQSMESDIQESIENLKQL